MKKYIRAAIANIRDESYEAKRDIAKNPETSVEILEELSKDSNIWVRNEVVNNPNTPPELLDAMAGVDYITDRVIASNPNTPLQTLQELIHSEDIDTQQAVVSNPNATPELINIFNNDYDSLVREISNFILEDLGDKLHNYLEDLPEILRRNISRYKTSWYAEPYGYDSLIETIRREHGSDNYSTTLEDIVEKTLLGNFSESE